MKNYIGILIALLLLCTDVVFAQKKGKYYKSKFNQANVYLINEKIVDALPVFLELYKKDSLNANLNFKIGLCYMQINAQKQKAIPYFERAKQKLNNEYNENDYSEKNAPFETLYFLAFAYYHESFFEKALINYQFFLDYLIQNKGDKKIIRDIENEIIRCKTGVELLKTKSKVKVENLGAKINTAYPDYSPLISADERMLIFTSRRRHFTTGKFDDNVYVSYKDGLEWQEAKLLSDSINTSKNDATVGLSADGEQLFLYKEGDIYVSHFNGTAWSKPQKLNENINTKAFEPSACISSDGNTLYFISDRKGGLGGKDIYKSQKLPNGDWGLAENLGATINTTLDEESPFIAFSSNSLYFSSQGHNSIGGHDLFISKLNENNQWQKPENIGFPINTTDDDIFFVTAPDEKHAYYSSSAEGNIGETDIYKITFEEKEETETTILIGKIINKAGGDISSNIEITVVDFKEKQRVQIYKPNTKTGKYIFSLTPGLTYKIIYHIDSKEFDKEILEVPEGSGYRVLNREIELKTIAYGNNPQNVSSTNNNQELAHNNSKNNNQKANYNNSIPNDNKTYNSESNTSTTNNNNSINNSTLTNNVSPNSKINSIHFLFALGQSSFTNKALSDLRKLSKIMKKNPSLTIIVEGHTDSVGSSKFNTSLSARRAKAVKNYLVSLGVPAYKIKTIGKGEDSPIAINTDLNGKANKKGMNYNRRIDLILSKKQDDYIIPLAIPIELKYVEPIKTKF